MKRRLWRYLLLTSYAIVLFASGALVALVGAAILYVNSKPDLAIWHTADLDGEFTAGSRLKDFREYLELEEALFAELKSEVYDRIEESERSAFNRYTRAAGPTLRSGRPTGTGPSSMATRKPPSACSCCTAIPTVPTACAASAR